MSVLGLSGIIGCCRVFSPFDPIGSIRVVDLLIQLLLAGLNERLPRLPQSSFVGDAFIARRFPPS